MSFEMSCVLHKLMQAGYTFSEAAITSLSPYLTEHISRLGTTTLIWNDDLQTFNSMSLSSWTFD
jgi:hypothetical protein